jgi:hypothetical protein
MNDTAPASVLVPIALIKDVMHSCGTVSDPDDPVQKLYALIPSADQ